MRLSSILNQRKTAWVVLASSLVVTLIAWAVSQNNLQTRVNDKLNYEADALAKVISQHMLEYEVSLKALNAFIQGSDEITQDEWNRFIENLEIDK